jgi:response regulator RpfG family c-di-GMP phosphodiesterase
LKPASLTEAEWKIMKKHPEIGWEILLNVEVLKSCAEIVLTHEERFDGSGYPRRLRGEQIPLGARIFALMDTLDAMASDRPYRKAMPFPLIEAEIFKGKGTQFDPEVIEGFQQYLHTFEEWVRWDKKKPCKPYWERQIEEEPDRVEKTAVMDLV